MIYETLDQRGASPRLESALAEAIAQRGLVPVLIAALRAWWKRPRLPPDLPARLRADIGLPLDDSRMTSWMDVPIHPRRGP